MDQLQHFDHTFHDSIVYSGNTPEVNFGGADLVISKRHVHYVLTKSFTKSFGVAIKMKAPQLYICIVLFA